MQSDPDEPEAAGRAGEVCEAERRMRARLAAARDADADAFTAWNGNTVPAARTATARGRTMPCGGDGEVEGGAVAMLCCRAWLSTPWA